MDSLRVGMKHVQDMTVEERHTTRRGDYRVFSTPSMTQFVEMTAQALAAPHLKPGQGQVGTMVTIRHLAPTPLGRNVRAEAELVAIDRRKLTFKVKVYDEVEQLGDAEHERFVIDVDKYVERLRKKIGA